MNEPRTNPITLGGSRDVTYDLVDSWPLPSGDEVRIIRRTAVLYAPDMSYETHRSYTFHVQAANGRKIAGGGETYVSKWNAQRAARRSFPAVTGD